MKQAWAHTTTVWRSAWMLILVLLVLSTTNGPLNAQTYDVPSGVPTEAPGTVTTRVPPTRLIMSGCAAPNAFLTFFDGSTPVGSAVAGNDGRFQKTITVNDFGLHTFRLYYDDINGRTSSTISYNISLATQQDTALNVLLPTTIEHEPEPLVIGNFLIFRGTTCPFALVNVIINNSFTLVAQADNRGNWYAIADSSNFSPGKYTYEAVSSLDNRISNRTQKYQFTTLGQGAPRQDPPELTTPVITEPSDGFISGSDLVTVRGNAPANTQLEIYIDDELAGSVFTNGLGEWSFNLNLQQSQQQVSVRACHNNSCSDFSNTIRLYYNGSAVNCQLAIGLERYRFFDVERNGGIDLNFKQLKGSPPFTISIDWGDTTVETISKLDSTLSKYHHVYKLDGNYNGSITLADASGCRQTQYFAVSVGETEPPNWWLMLFIPAGAALVMMVPSYVNAISPRAIGWRLRRFGRPLGPVYPRPAHAEDKKPKNNKEAENTNPKPPAKQKTSPPIQSGNDEIYIKRS